MRGPIRQPFTKADEKKDGPCFPNHTAFPNSYEMVGGLTKREYFAALAMQANADNEDMTPAQCAEVAVQLADALIIALNKEA